MMLSQNIKAMRKEKGLSQEELAIKLNVVRQTVSKWEQGLSVPDASLLVSLSEALETSVSVLLGEQVTEQSANELKTISEKLEVINLQLARQQTARHKTLHGLLIAFCVLIVVLFILLFALNSPYMGWNQSEMETAVMGTAYHAFEWAFFRIAPILLLGGIVGIVLTRKK